MTDPTTRRRMLDLSVVAISALVLGASTLLVAEVDRPRLLLTAPAASGAPAATLATGAPLDGLRPAPRPQRRVVVVRRSRAS